jgi:ankyrin repeat protein
LRHASDTGNIQVVKYLVESSVNINLEIDHCMNPFETACCYGNLDIVKYLHHMGADIHVDHDSGYSTVDC